MHVEKFTFSDYNIRVDISFGKDFAYERIQSRYRYRFNDGEAGFA